MTTILAKLNPSEERVTARVAGDYVADEDAIRYRKNIRNLSSDELAALREAFIYEYITSEITPSPLVTASAAAPSKFTAPVVGFALGQLESDFEEAELQFHNVKHPRNSFEMRVFLNQPDADASTETNNNSNYAGSLYFFGHGECAGDEGHCDPDRVRRGKFDLRPPSHVAPFTLYLDTTECIRNLADEGEVTVRLVAVDSDGNQLEDPGTDFDAIALVTR